LAKERDVRNIANLPSLTESTILKWADDHYKRTGKWPTNKSRLIIVAPSETWSGVNRALYNGSRGLAKQSSLAQLLAKERGARNKKDLPSLTESIILKWADNHYKSTGKWPNAKSGLVHATPGEKWNNIDAALSQGLRGLSKGSSVAKLLSDNRGIRNRAVPPSLTESIILKWADDHYKRTGKWPARNSGPVHLAPEETWLAVNHALERGTRGLSGGSSLAKLLKQYRGM
jgi:hypothetical protein